MESNPTVGQRIRQFRQDRGWSMDQLAIEVGKRGHSIGTNAIYRIETGRSPSPRRSSILAIAAALEIDERELTDATETTA